MPSRIAYVCKVKGCGKPHKSRGYCSFHWTRWYEGRPVELPVYYNRSKKRGWVHHGYKWISTPEGEVMLHRHKMEKHLGRKLHEDECVHHKNGDKLDNRLCNLEIVPRDTHTAQHRAHKVPCLVCKSTEYGSHGLCHKHVGQARRFIERFELILPQRGYACRVVYMGIALALNNGDVIEALESLQNGDRISHE